MPTCGHCSQEKSLSEFYGTKKRDGWCKDCRKDANKAYYRANKQKVLAARAAWGLANPERDKFLKVRSTYGLTEEQWAGLVGSPCAICGAQDDLQVDHDHSCCGGPKSCGSCVRGMLCRRCNTGLGIFADRTDLLENAMHYLEESG